jgi:hypothetical protein
MEPAMNDTTSRSGFTLDTSGAVVDARPAYQPRLLWKHLSPFTQGYIEALIQDIEWPDPAEGFGPSSAIVRFSDLAPEALALILKDCADVRRRHDRLTDGGAFWRERKTQDWPQFPPLTPYLSGDGKVHLRPDGPAANSDS